MTNFSHSVLLLLNTIISCLFCTCCIIFSTYKEKIINVRFCCCYTNEMEVERRVVNFRKIRKKHMLSLNNLNFIFALFLLRELDPVGLYHFKFSELFQLLPAGRMLRLTSLKAVTGKPTTQSRN